MAAANPRRRKIAWIIAGISAAVTLTIWGVGWLNSAELSLYDVRLVGATSTEVDQALLPVPVDDYTMQKIGRFPWRRPVTGALLQRIDEMGASVVAGDLLFSGRSYDPSDDRVVGEILATTDTLLLAYGGQHSERVSAEPTEDQLKAKAIWDEKFLETLPVADNPPPHIKTIATVLLPIPEVVETTTQFGYTGIKRDPDGRLRRVPLIVQYGDRYMLSFTLAAVAMHLQVDTAQIEVTPRTIRLPNARLTDGSVKDVVIPINDRGEMWIRYHLNPAWFADEDEDGNLRTMSAADVILTDDEAVRKQIQGRIAVVYTSFSGNSDFHPTPRSQNYPGGLIQIEAMNTILREEFLTYSPKWVTVLLIILMAAGVALIGPPLSSFRMALFGLGLFFATMLGAALAFRVGSFVLEMVPPMMVVALSTVSLLVYRTWIEERERIDLMWTLRVLEKQALNERQQRAQPTTLRGITEGSAQVDDPTNALRRNIEYGRFIESLREVDSLPNTYIGKNYRLLRLLDEGGMGLVFLAEDEALGRTVCIKVLTKYSAKLLDRFKLEAKAVGQIDNENVVKVFAVASEGDIPYIVMEYVKGRSLSQKIREEGPLDLESALKVVRQVALGLDAAHCKNIIHRDIKTSNVLIDENGDAKIIDFGIAKFFKGSDEAITGSREILGTADYMSPEQGAGKTLTHKTDIYSLGIVLYRTLTGRLPFRAEDTVAVLLKHMREPLPDITKRRPDVPPTVIAILNKMTAKNPDDRYVDCQELANDIEQVLGELSPTAAHDDAPVNIAGSRGESV